jgi:hypothetical protein
VASRVEAGEAPSSPEASIAPPRLGATVRAAFSDFYFNSVRLVPLNLVWGAAALAIALVAWTWPPGALVAAPFLAVPAGALFALAAAIVRGGQSVGVRDALAAGRAKAGQAILVGTGWLVAVVVLLTNFVNGLEGATAANWLIATSAGWGLAILWCAALVVWPLMLDPANVHRSVQEDLHLAAALLLVAPIRFGALGALTAIVLIVSTILTAALLTISVAFVALVACRTVYPVADRVERQLSRRTD